MSKGTPPGVGTTGLPGQVVHVDLFSSVTLGPLQLRNRVVMAPMTRCRALGNVANELMRSYYAQRASAGLIISEGIAPSPNALGYARIPALFEPAHVSAWRKVTESVHAQGGKMFAQLMHVGRVAHTLNLPEGARILTPSAVQTTATIWTDQQGLQPYSTPEAMSLADIRAALAEFRQASLYALEAGFDGIELHGANGYLLEQFLHPHYNLRTDDYGGSVANRARFVVEAARACADAIGPERVGIRLSPYGTFNEMPPYEGTHALYEDLARSLRGLLYVHLIDSQHENYAQTLATIRKNFAGPLIRNLGFDRARAEQTLAASEADLISFGRPFVANPDLVMRMQNGQSLATPDPDTFYTAEPRGYIDYPALSPNQN